ncbi:MAG: synthase [Hyphomicrobiales bacterium]|jgi:uncharacterized integral membrane protein|nr:synthase [Hyphomicrobiales bacterium]
MVAFLKWLLLAPVAIVAIMLALANRAPVTVMFDPFGGASELSITAPLFLVLFGAVMTGVLLGGFGSWLRQGRYRKASRDARAEAMRNRAEADRLRAQMASFPALGGPSDRRAA